jgi:hypothetical protein
MQEGLELPTRSGKSGLDLLTEPLYPRHSCIHDRDDLEKHREYSVDFVDMDKVISRFRGFLAAVWKLNFPAGHRAEANTPRTHNTSSSRFRSEEEDAQQANRALFFSSKTRLERIWVVAIELPSHIKRQVSPKPSTDHCATTDWPLHKPKRAEKS